MPEFASVHGPVPCWNCHRIVDSQVDIQWGIVPHQYNIGDKIQWMNIGDRLVPPFVLVAGYGSWNCGDPSVDSVIAFDCNLYAIDNVDPPTCPECSNEIAGVVVEIQKNKIESVRAYSRRELDDFFHSHFGKADIFELKPNGESIARPDWLDHPVRYVESFP